ncbi:ATP-binding protein [Streptomyces sp. NPDC126497]|uniref:ATP-binding protein n=1 Tax=Streptomyces sp. NPDC126497 TaxID=3155313 RepID=UPI00331A450C
MTLPSERPTAAPVRDFTVLLSPTPRGARLARLLGAEQLRSWGLPVDPARQVIAEPAVDAATHGRVPGRDFRLTFHVVADTLRIEVTDTRGERLPDPQPASPEAGSGRGLLPVEALADRWGVTEGRFPRKTVWAELRLTAPEPESWSSGAVGALPLQEPGGKDPTKPHPFPPEARDHSGG